MCGRFAAFRSEQDLADEFTVDEVDDDARLLPPSWNVAPTDGVRMVVERADRATGAVTRALRLARWGLVPSWARDPSVGARMINARIETVAAKPAFARPLASRRALVPADGYFEWQRPAAVPGVRRPAKQAFYLRRPGGEVAALAALFDFWRDRARADDDPARWLVTATVLTRPATPALAAIHDRQPVMLARPDWDAWLSPTVGAEQALGLLDGPPPELVAVPVSPLVNAVANNSPALVEPVAPPAGTAR